MLIDDVFVYGDDDDDDDNHGKSDNNTNNTYKTILGSPLL